MRCLFCKKDSTKTKSVEHIVPESLGNKTFILPLGYVCDKCNNYFAREVEKPFLELPEIKLLRFQEVIPNKKNRVPVVNGMINGIYPVKLKRKISHDEIINEIEVSKEVMDAVSNNKNMNVIIPAFTNKNHFKSNSIISRFLAKMALESFADKLKDIDNSLDDLIDDTQFDRIRNHARLGTEKDWPCSIRRIYDYNKIWKYDDENTGVMVHESDFLLIAVPDDGEVISDSIFAELYFVVALWGMEFAINMAGPETSGYEGWLKEHNYESPLYFGKNEHYKNCLSDL